MPKRLHYAKVGSILRHCNQHRQCVDVTFSYVLVPMLERAAPRVSAEEVIAVMRLNQIEAHGDNRQLWHLLDH